MMKQLLTPTLPNISNDIVHHDKQLFERKFGCNDYKSYRSSALRMQYLSLNTFAAVEDLNLSKCNLDVFPMDLGFPSTLRKLNLSRNRFAEIPDINRFADTLEELDVSHNLIVHINATLMNFQFYRLRRLKLFGNRISSINSAILTPNLEFLELGYESAGNQLKRLPDDMFLNLAKLRSIDLSNNNLSRIPRSIGTLQYLRILKIAHNRLNYLPDCFLQLRCLEQVNLEDNRILQLPKSLSTLANAALEMINIMDNQLIFIPLELINSKKIAILLSGNPCVDGTDNRGKMELSISPLKTKIPTMVEMCVRLLILNDKGTRQNVAASFKLTKSIVCYICSGLKSCATCPLRFLQENCVYSINRPARGYPEVTQSANFCSFNCSFKDSCINYSSATISYKVSENGYVLIDPNDLLDIKIT